YRNAVERRLHQRLAGGEVPARHAGGWCRNRLFHLADGPVLAQCPCPPGACSESIAKPQLSSIQPTPRLRLHRRRRHPARRCLQWRMSMRCLPHPLVFASLACMLVAASGPATAQSDPASLYRHNCAGCHGSDRQGTGLGPPLSPQAYRYGGTRADIARIIGRGIASQGMPAFDGTLTPGQIDALAAFLPAREAAAQEQEEDAEAAAPQRVSDPAPGATDTLDYAVRAAIGR